MNKQMRKKLCKTMTKQRIHTICDRGNAKMRLVTTSNGMLHYPSSPPPAKHNIRNNEKDSARVLNAFSRRCLLARRFQYLFTLPDYFWSSMQSLLCRHLKPSFLVGRPFRMITTISFLLYRLFFFNSHNLSYCLSLYTVHPRDATTSAVVRFKREQPIAY